MRQFHLRDHYFADLVRDDAGNLTTSGDGWVRITSQAGIDAICASITNGGEVWLNDKGQLCVSGPAPAPGMVFDRQKGWQGHSSRKPKRTSCTPSPPPRRTLSTQRRGLLVFPPLSRRAGRNKRVRPRPGRRIITRRRRSSLGLLPRVVCRSIYCGKKPSARAAPIPL